MTQQRVPSVTAPFRTPYRVEHLVHDGYVTAASLRPRRELLEHHRSGLIPEGTLA